jgi:hypothetical protein
MKQEIKQVKLKDIVFKENLYPRTHTDYSIVGRYVNAMLTGATFPPITLARFKGKLVLIDGKHRQEACRSLKRSTILAEILSGFENEKQIYLESIKRNISHGKQFSTQEVLKIAMTLKHWKMNREQIAKLIHWKADKFEHYLAERVVKPYGKEEIVLKAPLRHLRDDDIAENFNQNSIIGTQQTDCISQTISMIKQGMFDMDDKKVFARLKSLYRLLDKIFG